MAGLLGGVLSHPPLVGAAIDTAVLGGAGALLLALFGYLFKELRRKDEGVWAIVADRDKRLLELTADRNYWRALAMGEEPPVPPLVDPTPAPVLADESSPLLDVVSDAVTAVRRRRRR
jgi:hypothetical protein